MHAKYVVIQLGYMNQVSICAKYVAIQLDKKKYMKLAEFLPPSQQVLRLQLLLLIVSHNCFENSFAGGTAYKNSVVPHGHVISCTCTIQQYPQ